ncbi:methyltransferase domain-containing protein [Candidatus Woesearchaeota archaeon]|jgi:tRNA (adenine57-N1/adenine58-N1)-methyltransferase catalytic subunit|nr:methyltransferase domain-containing protein [Candidatus Woesearchaeota archaeon]MBT5397117.1 methyltransferase domain-containing protein [Candidatus Woesearchaeota archaeon]MBT5924647.1 methyltransferase domain-containing protein [Candidatus Woesearchaeota archaeon]MBT6367337.1 methyltransferase domain-containing protein [Candidatus Woesearchaeota archaeon]MBT7762517.1 methyltransferase domain-containing protein [Candidatus Woesearchaeota archaeon]
MRNIKKILIEQKTGKKYFVKDLDDNFHTSAGIISKKDLVKNGIVQSSKKKSFFCFEPTFIDFWENLRKGPQIVQQKDIGLILAKTGVNKNSVVVDAGGGSGSLCLSLANICKKITVYEVNKGHFDILEKNVKEFGAKNITLKHQNIYNGIDEKNVDILTLDLPEPWQVLDHAEKALKVGSFMVVYLPNLTQVKMFLDTAQRTSITVLETIEILERQWKIEDRIMRPEHEMLGHTAFLVFCRKF